MYRSLRDELVEMTGPKVYRKLVAYLEQRADGSVPLAHPVVRKKKSNGSAVNPA